MQNVVLAVNHSKKKKKFEKWCTELPLSPFVGMQVLDIYIQLKLKPAKYLVFIWLITFSFTSK